MTGQPKPAFYVIVGVVVVALIGFAIWRLSPKPNKTPATTPDIAFNKDTGKQVEVTPEPPNTDPGLTEKEYEFVPQEKLIPVKGVGKYKPLKDTNNTVRFAINVWAGWGPIILANEGFKSGKEWKMPDGTPFKVELVLIDDPVAMRSAYTNGEVHIGWATLDMLPLILQTLVNDKGQPIDAHAMPRVYQQIDWSNGGDGIVVRDRIKTTADLKNTEIALAQKSPSHYFALNMLVAAGVQPRDVKFDFTKTAFQAAAAFNAKKDIAACVSWSPDIYNLTKVKGNKMLVTTAQANKLIADVWFARADFARDYPGIIEGLVRGIFDAMEEMADKEDARKKAAQLMADKDGYNIPLDAANDMLGDAHNTNWAENFQFFLNQNNPTNFEHVWKNAYALYSHPQVKEITHPAVSFDQVMDFSVIKKLGQDAKYAAQKDRSRVTAAAPLPVPSEDTSEIVGSRFNIRFYPESADLHKTVLRKKDGKDVEELYDPAVDDTLAKIAQFIETFGAARVVIEGHTDSSMKNKVPAADLPALLEAVKKLSEDRAKAVKQALVEKYKVDANRVSVRGVGWDRPADPADKDNNTKNRRVEVKIYPAEAADK
jgi:outer membrane protein OmpA-like peptidoglycan-associated protein/ABC-type nitrate/sulfonate/bicarbonate transport system substrate-binding protein